MTDNLRQAIAIIELEISYIRQGVPLNQEDADELQQAITLLKTCP